MDAETRRKIKGHLDLIKVAITQLQTHLPPEQSHVGSELQKIDSLTNALFHRYVKETSEPTSEDNQE